MLEIKGLYKIYDKYHALSGLGINVSSDALYEFTESDGTGKATTIKIMADPFTADEGKITIDGTNALRDLKDLKVRIGYAPDFFGVYDNLTVSEYMEFFASCHHLGGLVARKRHTALLEQVSLGDKLDFYVDGLSRSMKQRLCLTRALIHDPPILILDEPTSGPDPGIRFESKEILKGLQESGRTVVISSHVLSELSELCTDIGIIDQGRMVLEENIDDVLSRADISNLLMVMVSSNLEKVLFILKSHLCVQTTSLREQDIHVRFSGDTQDEALLLRQLINSDVLVNGSTRGKSSLGSAFMQLAEHEEEKVAVSYDAESGFQSWNEDEFQEREASYDRSFV